MSVKTRLHLPYYNNSTQFERVYGSITIDGVSYEYVKRRVHNDTLELLCLPNRVKSDLQNKGNAIAKTAAQDDSSAPAKSGSVLKLSLPDFFQTLAINFPPVATRVNNSYFLSNTLFVSSEYLVQPYRPPQSI